MLMSHFHKQQAISYTSLLDTNRQNSGILYNVQWPCTLWSRKNLAVTFDNYMSNIIILNLVM